MKRKRPLEETLKHLRDREPPSRCPEASVLRDFLEEALSEEQMKEVAYHLAECSACAREVLAWEEVNRADEALLEAFSRPVPARPRSLGASLRQVGKLLLRPRPALAAAGALAAVLLIVAGFLYFRGPEAPPAVESVRLLAASGVVRAGSPVFSPREQLQLEAHLPRPAYLYVVAIWDGNAQVVWPEEQAVALAGTVTLPRGKEGEERTWQDLDPGHYTLVVGVRKEPLSAAQKASLCKKLASEADVRQAASAFFSDLGTLHFQIR